MLKGLYGLVGLDQGLSFGLTARGGGAEGGGGVAAPATAAFTDQQFSSSSTSTATFTMNIGAEDANRMVVVALSWASGSMITLSSASVNGVAATIVQQVSNSNRGAAIVIAAVPTGTTGVTVSATFSGALGSRCIAGVYRCIVSDQTPVDHQSVGPTSGTTVRTPIAVQKDGIVIVSGAFDTYYSGATISYDGTDTATLDYNYVPSSGDIFGGYLGGHAATTETASRNIGFTSLSSVSMRMAAASWR